MGEPSVVQEILFFLVPATVFGVMIGLGVFVGVYFAVSLVMKKGGTYSGSAPRDAADIARDRYARGEISRQEYEQLREDLRDAR
ncbi:MAG: SHOCT domain-containing protein [Rubrobacteraceae bacterium]